MRLLLVLVVLFSCDAMAQKLNTKPFFTQILNGDTKLSCFSDEKLNVHLESRQQISKASCTDLRYITIDKITGNVRRGSLLNGREGSVLNYFCGVCSGRYQCMFQ